MNAIGIDIGTTSICGAVIDGENGIVRKSKTIPSNAFLITGNAWEKIQDVKKIIEIARTICDEFLEEYDAGVIGLTGQMHGIVYVDDAGQAVSPLYTWQDGRGNLPYRDTTYAEYLGSCSGYGNVTDFYNRVNGIRPASAVTYCTIQDYLGMVLCQNPKPVIHTSDAASFGLYDLTEKKFCCEYSGEITDEFRLIGSYRGVPVSAAIGDNQASVFSTLAEETDLLLNIGTGSQISMISEKPVFGKNIESRPYIDGKFLVVGAALCGGRAYSMLKNFFEKVYSYAGVCDADVYEIMNRMLSKKRDTTLQVDTRFDGTRWDQSARGCISGIGTDNLTPEDFCLGFLEGILGELHSLYLEMGIKKTGIVGSGNGIRKNQKMIETAEKIFGGKVKVPSYVEEAAFGAALFGLISVGECKSVREAQKLIRYEER
ncbi:MAG: FGGY family carbohydrate kinase [Fusicatenibacter sp.]|nr:FGGY family carbohydrate kinase [Lachnospiraceae bacterium]MDY2938132.1 FGGY family carbohydrate kinase [Fusicatenibacter sp.]